MGEAFFLAVYFPRHLGFPHAAILIDFKGNAITKKEDVLAQLPFFEIRVSHYAFNIFKVCPKSFL